MLPGGLCTSRFLTGAISDQLKSRRRVDIIEYRREGSDDEKSVDTTALFTFLLKQQAASWKGCIDVHGQEWIRIALDERERLSSIFTALPSVTILTNGSHRKQRYTLSTLCTIVDHLVFVRK